MRTKSTQLALEVLGVPMGTAQNKLRKKIIFALISGRIGACDICCKCNNVIESEDDMTIEHLKPWLGRENGKGLFWDLSNISFSHRWCNRPHVAVLRPRPLKHGWVAYNRKGCRCEVCKEASQEHNKGRYKPGNCRSSIKSNTSPS